MKRELKFRFRIKWKNEISFVFLRLSELLVTTLLGEILSVDEYTSLKDKNEKEIYEGDILKESESGIFEVTWDARWCKFRLEWERTSPSIQYPEWNRGVKMEIIGNVHENPELLNE